MTTGLDSGHGTTDQPLSPADELACWRDVGARLWPFVRYFGLCGGCPESLEVVADLAQLLGHHPDPQPITAPAGPSREALLQEFCEVLQAGLRGRILTRTIEPFVDAIRQRLASPDTMQQGDDRAEVVSEDA